MRAALLAVAALYVLWACNHRLALRIRQQRAVRAAEQMLKEVRA